MTAKTDGSKIELVIKGISHRIAVGDLQPGDRLRSIRVEADLIGVGKNTVVEAYLRLVAQGVLISRPGSGFYVQKSTSPRSAPKLSPFAGIPDGAALLTEQLERRLRIRPGDGRLPVDWLEDSQLRRAISGLKLRAPETYNYNTARGFPLLRERLSGALGERGIRCGPEQILMTHGANHAMDLVIRSYIRSGDAVLVDEPGYYPLFSKLHLAGARIIGVQRDIDGPDIEDFLEKAAASGARFFFTQSLAHNPTGGTTSLARAYALLKAAARFDITIVEDDPFADILPYSTPRLASLDQLERVIYLGSFSKTIAGSFRSGFIAADQARVDELAELLVVTMVSTSSHNERLIYALIDQGHYLRHIRRLTARIDQAQEETIASLGRLGLQVPRPLGGSFYLWVKGEFRLDTHHLLASAADAGIFIAPGRAFHISGDGTGYMRVNIAHGANPVFLQWLETVLI